MTGRFWEELVISTRQSELTHLSCVNLAASFKKFQSLSNLDLEGNPIETTGRVDHDKIEKFMKLAETNQFFLDYQ